MKKYLILFAINFCFFIAKSQNYPNIDFEFGNFTGWQCFTGSCCPINASTVGPAVYDRHTITNPSDTDIYSGLPTVAPNGGVHSIRIGNSNSISESDKIEYTFIVSPQTRILTIYYQAVLQNGGHSIADQPQLAIDVKDNTTNLPVACTPGLFYAVSSTGPYPPNWHQSSANSSVIYSDWTPITFMLKNYIGHSITVSLSSGDCALGGHFGYAYFDVSILNDCDNGLTSSNLINLKAPAGMNFYLWDTLGTNNISPIDSVQSINVSSSDSTSIFYCITGACINSCGTNASNFVSNCMDTIYYNMATLHGISKPTAHFNYTINNLNVSFADGSSGGSAPITDWYWTFGDNNINNNQNPIHTYTASGKYLITLGVRNGNGCVDYFQDTITVTCFPNQLDAQFKDTFINGIPIIKPLVLDTNYISNWDVYIVDSMFSTITYFFSSTDSMIQMPQAVQDVDYLVLHKYYHKLFPNCSDSTGKVITIYPANTDTLSGYVWNDFNNNCLKEPNETNSVNFSSTSILILNKNKSLQTSKLVQVDPITGYYFTTLPTNKNIVSFYNPWGMCYAPYPINNAGYNFENTTLHTISNANFGMTITVVIFTGTVFFDLNNTWVYEDSIDEIYDNAKIYLDSIYHTTAAMGQYFLYGYNNNISYNIKTVAPNPGWIIFGGNFFASNYNTIYQLDLRLKPSPIAYPDANVSIMPIQLCYVNQPNCALKVQNIGNQNFNGTVTLNYQPGLTVIDPDSGIVNTVNHEITWNINNLTLAKTKTYNIKFDFPTSLPIGSTANFYATLNPSQVDSNLQNNTDSFSTIVLAAFDPNTKTASPPSDAVNHYIKGFDDLSYTINFQNTGNAPATNIVIVDTIAPNFDLNSFAFLEASFNPCYLKINASNRTIEFILNGIMLPDSMHDEPHSHGSISFKIKPLHTPLQGETYTNTAQIYFDNNPPIVTNTAIHKIDKNIKVQEVDNKYTIQILPNPMDNLSHLIIAPNPEKSMELTITDILGKEIRVLKSNNGNFAIEKKSLSSGYYNLIVRDANKIIAVEKLIVK